MINFDEITSAYQMVEYPADHPYRIQMVGGFGSGKTNALLNLISH